MKTYYHFLKIIFITLPLFVCIISCTNNSKSKNSDPTHTPNGNDDGQKPDPVITPPAPTIALSDAAYLRKLSLHIRGFAPTMSEYQKLQEAQKSKSTSAFFASVIKSYLNSSYHIEKMNHRLNEYFKLRPDTYFTTSDWPVFKSELEKDMAGEYEGVEILKGFLKRNALNDLFRTLVRDNESWDQLLTKKSYRVFDLGWRDNFDFGNITDKDFYAAIAKNQLPKAKNPEPKYSETIIQFNPDDKRIAGALTTPRFFARNQNTAVNKNRRRAATIFRMFLCDSMTAVAIDSSKEEEKIFSKVFPKTVPTVGGGSNSESDQHGSDPACMKCHYKLDPLGSTFAASPMAISPLASPGALVFKRSETEKVQLPVAGLGELAQKIVEQPEYKKCQSRLFWDWFVGNDVDYTPSVSHEIESQFEKSAHRVNDFVEYLVGTPQFMSRAQPVTEDELQKKVKFIFKRCDTCHKEEEDIPVFAEWPIGGSEATMKSYLEKITKQLDLNGDGRAAKMPPKKSDWKLSAQERSAIQLWVKQQNEPQHKQIQSFNPTQQRYLGGHDLILSLVNKFPLWKSKDNTSTETTELPNYCRFTDDETSLKLGISSPRTGLPTHDNPSPPMARWMYECGNAYIKSDFKNSLEIISMSHFFSEEIQTQFQLKTKEGLQSFLNTQWNLLNPEVQTKIIGYALEYLIGPEELMADLTQGQFSTHMEYTNFLMQKIPGDWNTQTLNELIPNLNLLLIMQDSFLQF